MRKKTDGAGEMVSAFVDENRGFGLPLSPAELEKVNAWRISRGKAPLTATPGVQYLEYGKNRQGYW